MLIFVTSKQLSDDEKKTNVEDIIKLNAEMFVYEQVKKSDVVINIPTKPIFFQEWNYRVVVGLFPTFNEYSGHRLWKMDVIKIADKQLERTSFGLNPHELTDILSGKFKGQEGHELKVKAVNYLKNFFTDDRITKDSFMKSYGNFLNDISIIIEGETSK